MLHFTPSQDSCYLYQMAAMFIPGIERIATLPFLHKCRVAMLTNDAALTAAGEKSRVYLQRRGYRLVKLFSPEHGPGANAPDGAFVRNSIDAATGLPVISLYGDGLKPLPADLADVDVVLYDIPDVGCRFYTYLWTLTHMMEACAETGIPLVVLDRPNPLGSNMEMAEGPMLDEVRCSSFIGRWAIPIRHCCSTGELARYFQAARLPALALHVVPMEGPEHGDSFWEHGIPFTPTSPAMQNAHAALLYAGTGLLEGINLSEGRGTPYPFEQAGAPWIDPHEWAKAIAETALAGVNLTAVDFTPEWGMYTGETCHGLRFRITDARTFRPVRFALHLLEALLRGYPEKAQPRLYTTRANPLGSAHLEKLTGVPHIMEQLAGGMVPDTAVQPYWAREMAPYFLYKH